MTWADPVDLVFWDLWGERILDDFRAWQGHIVPGGLFVAKVFEDGSCKEERLYAEPGWVRYKDYPAGVVYALKKTEAAHVFWIVNGEQYVKEAQLSAASVAKQMPELQQAVYLPNQREHKEWFIESTRLLVKVLEGLPDGAKCLWLDSDTYMLQPVPELFDMLDRFDMVLAHAPGHVTAKTVNPIPAAFPEFNIGVIAMRNNTRTRALWKWVWDIQKDHLDIYGDNDQAPLRELLWDIAGTPLRYAVMPFEYNCRWQIGIFLREPVKILHGRADSAEDYEHIANRLNERFHVLR